MARIEKEVFWPKIEPEAEKKGLKVLAVWENGVPPHHEQQAADQGSRRPAGHQAARARRQVAREDVPGLRRQPEPDEILRAVHGAADRRDGRPGESVHADLLGQAAGGAEVPVAVGPCVHAGVPDRRHEAVGDAACRRAQDRSRTRRRRRRRSSTRPRQATTSDLLGKLKQAGMQVNEVDKDAFVAASKSIYEEFGKEVAGAKAADRPRGGAAASDGARSQITRDAAA